MSTLADIPEMVPAAKVAKRLGVRAEVLYRASEAGEFARYYVFGRRKYYRLDQVDEAIREVVPGDPEQWRRQVAAIDAACPVQAARRRRAASRPARGSNGQASGGRNVP